MLLIGMYDSPYVRRVAISMKLCEIAFEHGDWSVGADFEKIRRYNPLVRVPTLVLDDGEVLLDSATLLDYLDEMVGPRRPLAGGRAHDPGRHHHGVRLHVSERGAEPERECRAVFGAARTRRTL